MKTNKFNIKKSRSWGLIFIFSCIGVFAHGQTVMTIYSGDNQDSSFYHSTVLNDGRMMVGGEYGILKMFDQYGVMTNVEYDNEGVNIIELEQHKNYVYLATDNSQIYRYDLGTGDLIKKSFKQFENRCFYDLIVEEDGTLLVCGGHTGIADGLKKVPHGFVAKINFDTEEVNYLWRNLKKFAWSLDKNAEGEITMAMFNGLNTDVKKLSSNSWKKLGKIKGLVHEIKYKNEELWYCGSSNIRFWKDGIVGKLSNGKNSTLLEKQGCLWSMEFLGDQVYVAGNKGNLVSVNDEGKIIRNFKIQHAQTFYDIELKENGRIFIFGHAKGAYLIQERK